MHRVYPLNFPNKCLYSMIRKWTMGNLCFFRTGSPEITTKGGANRTIIERMFEGLLAHKLFDLLPASNLLASLVLGKEDQEWLKRSYEWMTDDAREEGLATGP